MNNYIPEAQQHPYLFLFDGYAEGVQEPALSTFTSALLGAISRADPSGELVADLRGGLPGLENFAGKTSAVSSGPHQSGSTISYDMSVYKTVLWDMADALSGGDESQARTILDVLRNRKEECLVLSDLPDHIREAIDVALATCPGYIGSFPIDAGNPVMREAFYDHLMHLALIADGTVIQEKSVEGEEVWGLQGAPEFLPNGLKWVEHRFGIVSRPYKLEKLPQSSRGALSIERLARKTQTSVEGRVFQALRDAQWSRSHRADLLLFYG